MLDFARTPMGHKFIERTCPEIAKQLGRIANMMQVQGENRNTETLATASGVVDALIGLIDNNQDDFGEVLQDAVSLIKSEILER
jgi:hypothetical protein